MFFKNSGRRRIKRGYLQGAQIMGCSDISYGSLDSKYLFPSKVEKLVPKEVISNQEVCHIEKQRRKYFSNLKNFLITQVLFSKINYILTH